MSTSNSGETVTIPVTTLSNRDTVIGTLTLQKPFADTIAKVVYEGLGIEFSFAVKKPIGENNPELVEMALFNKVIPSSERR